MNLGSRIGNYLDSLGLTLNARRPVFKLHIQKLKKTLFKRNSLTNFEELGYWKLTNMPSAEDLLRYYRQEFWSHRGDQDDTVNSRDVSHYLDLRNLAGELFKAPRLKFLNFGAGHGGLSHIMWGLGADVVNIDPSIPPVSYLDRWRCFVSEEQALVGLGDLLPFSLIYGSHSLEHVRDIEETLDFFFSLSDSNTLFLFEVPDSLANGNGGKDGKVSPPHTYYFTWKFFHNNFSEIVELSSIKSGVMAKHSGNLPDAKLASGQGDSIRFLGRGLRRSSSREGASENPRHAGYLTRSRVDDVKITKSSH
jgi:hypothetical protein